jgi:D-alanine-D-alanine ligase
MKIVVLYNAISEGAPLEDQDLLVQVESVAASLRRLGHEPTPVGCTLDLAAMRDDLLRRKPDVVFNIVESLDEADSLVYLPHAVLDAIGIPYAGNRTESLFLTTHKLLAKQRLHSAGLPTPPWLEEMQGCTESHRAEETERCAASGAALSDQKTSWILKGVWDQASRGMDDDAVLRDVDVATVRRRLQARFAQSGRPCFAEQFIEGREFNLSVLTTSEGPKVMPPAEIVFSAYPPGKPRIVGHRAKWQADSFEYNNTPRTFDFVPTDRSLLDELQSLARRCWPLFGLRGWARVDFRVDEAGRPWILEINANPCLSPDAGFAAALERAGISFDTAVANILHEAVA